MCEGNPLLRRASAQHDALNPSRFRVACLTSLTVAWSEDGRSGILLDIEKKKCVLNTHVKQLKLTLFIQAISKIIHQFNKNNRNVLVFIFHSQCEFHKLQYGNAAEEMRWSSLKQLNAWVQTRVFLVLFLGTRLNFHNQFPNALLCCVYTVRSLSIWTVT